MDYSDTQDHSWGPEDNVPRYPSFRFPPWTTRSISDTDVFVSGQRGVIGPPEDEGNENDPLDVSPVKLIRTNQNRTGFHKLLANLKLDPPTIITEDLEPNHDPGFHFGKPLRAETAPPMVGRMCLSVVGSTETSEKTRLKEEAKTIRMKLSLSPRRKPKLEILTNTSQPELNCLSPDIVSKLITGAFNHFYDKVIIIDCRFDYEYNAGHVQGALNFPQMENLVQFLIEDTVYHFLGDKLCLVFHCEFSSHRAPKAYNKIRSLDRKRNEYPKLFYPEMYLLEGGYKEFFKQQSDLCEPHGYVEMRDPSYISEMRLAIRTLSRSKSQKRFFSRSCSNIFIEMDRNSAGTTDMEEVPSTPVRTNSAH